MLTPFRIPSAAAHSTARPIAGVAVVTALLVSTLTGCTAPATSEPAPTQSAAPAESMEEVPTVCLELGTNPDGGRFWDVADVFGLYATEPATTTHESILQAIATIDEMRDGASGDVDEALLGMRGVFEDIELRYSGDDPLHPIDYQAFQDESLALADACEDAVDQSS